MENRNGKASVQSRSADDRNRKEEAQMKHNKKHVQKIKDAGFTQVVDYWHGVKLCPVCEKETRHIIDIVNGGLTVTHECRDCNHYGSNTP